MSTIRVKPEEAWKYFAERKNTLKDAQLSIAENEEYGVEVFMSAFDENVIKFSVFLGTQEKASEYAVSEDDCKKTLKELYDKYLTDRLLDDENFEECSQLEIEDMISEREADFDEAIMYLVNLAIEDDGEILGDDYDDIIEDVKDHILEYMARKHGLGVRRPMILEDEDGEEFFEEYPYECMEFEDEDNPIYK